MDNHGKHWLWYKSSTRKRNLVEVLVCINNKGISPLQSYQCNIRPGSLISPQIRSIKEADIVSLKCSFCCWNSCYYLSFAIWKYVGLLLYCNILHRFNAIISLHNLSFCSSLSSSDQKQLFPYTSVMDYGWINNICTHSSGITYFSNGFSTNRNNNIADRCYVAFSFKWLSRYWRIVHVEFTVSETLMSSYPKHSITFVIDTSVVKTHPYIYANLNLHYSLF